MRIVSITFVLLGLFLQGCVAVAGSPDAVGSVESTSGEPTIIRGSRLLNMGEKMPVLEGDILITHSNDDVSVEMDDKTLLSLGSDSELTIQSWSKQDVVIISSRGKVTITTGKNAQRRDASFVVRTPFAEITAIEGRFWIAHQTDHLQVLMLEEGEVRVSNPEGGITLTQPNDASAVRFIGPPEKASIFRANQR